VFVTRQFGSLIPSAVSVAQFFGAGQRHPFSATPTEYPPSFFREVAELGPQSGHNFSYHRE